MNKKLVAAMLHTGLGESDVNNLLSLPLTYQLYHTEYFLYKVCALNAADRMLILFSAAEESVWSVDAGWQKRGSGKCYDSLSGHCSMIGNKTGKVLGYSIRSKSCRICHQANKANRTPEEHDCRRTGTVPVKVNNTLGLSPGTYTRQHFTLKDLQHRKRKAIASTIKAKQRRLHLKVMRSQKRTVQEVREGTTYSAMVDMSEDTDADDLVSIPPPLPVPVQEPSASTTTPQRYSLILKLLA
ncbi:LOW QUALITY PROTEIN: uncharacterized protein LOC124291375 [Haliotis rubra]|uniref:LOW QUALITY PROTEIN: uncharacterized protein LOC124291375 n=1 Tax=Haliotis rubra TaxID=36100 RepID=UPI001EE5C60A|nr:LOW QUALITY PROTEIN: uncharacterized protein LOC124291375 [Haliotis rubra]